RAALAILSRGALQVFRCFVFDANRLESCDWPGPAAAYVSPISRVLRYVDGDHHLCRRDFGLGLWSIQRYRQLQFHRALLPRSMAWSGAFNCCVFISGFVASEKTSDFCCLLGLLRGSGLYDQARCIYRVNAGFWCRLFSRGEAKRNWSRVKIFLLG